MYIIRIIIFLEPLSLLKYAKEQHEASGKTGAGKKESMSLAPLAQTQNAIKL